MDYDNATLAIADPQPSDQSTNSIRDIDLAEAIGLRSGVAAMPHTKTEAESVGKLLQTSKIKPQTITGADATESAFKQRSGRSDRIIHIATHGFYADSDNSRNQDSHLTDEQRTLMHSGLLFSGANVYLRGGVLPSNINDEGILTAAEVADMNLNGVDLITLSACETGLGLISAEGVFGLQRGFKKAGANSLLMSLWKVDDEATKLLMIHFYDNVLHGKGKTESQNLAQNAVREYTKEIVVDEEESLTPSQRRQRERRGEDESQEPTKTIVKPYKDFRYWGAFILLDALD